MIVLWMYKFSIHNIICFLKILTSDLFSKYFYKFQSLYSYRKKKVFGMSQSWKQKKFSHARWLIVIVNMRTDTWIFNLCDASTSEREQFDNYFVLTKFIINNTTDAWKTDFNLLSDGGGGTYELFFPQVSSLERHPQEALVLGISVLGRHHRRLEMRRGTNQSTRCSSFWEYLSNKKGKLF